ncbi:hypothetical protein G195_006930 [Phytophthora kernoviae 00238/432]|uniref:Methyltransferase domain-containing protein n=1 Tax=Phytophthora kernoviae 00238/432 TaxID=1284355 RepID=A0A8J4S8E4_9STRA|nr:hypothetical protein G195_006930 [Phytophthora kernoviae 00238/432]
MALNGDRIVDVEWRGAAGAHSLDFVLRLQGPDDAFTASRPYPKLCLTEQETSKLAHSVELRSNGEPLAYVLGRKEFWSLEFAVSKDTLIPRSDSEVLIETLVDQFDSRTPLRILDIGTGSGCLLLSALAEFPHATGVGIDISQAALAVAEQNARSNKLDQRATFTLRDLKALPELREDAEADHVLYQRFDVILCNPPYIPCRELHLVAPDVLKYEPHLALFSDGGPTVADDDMDPQGLRMYRLLHESVANLFKSSTASSSSPLPATRSCLLMEIGSEDQARAVQALFSNSARIGDSSDGVNNAPSQLRFERFLLDATQAQQLQTAQNSLKTEIDTLKAENATLNKKAQQSQQLLEKQRELSAAQEAKQRILEGQLSAAEARAEETQRAEKMTSQQFRSKDVRLNRALEELEKAKAQLQEEKRSHGEQMVTKAEYDQVVRDSKKLDKQKGELLAAFKKQMKLIDLLKRQRIHMEAAKMLSFTEAEFSKTLELG